jgi:hypothetical protein
MTGNGSASYVYDAENRLIAAGGYSYIYDGDGQRVEKCTEGATPGACASGATGTLYWRGTGSDTLAESDLSGNALEDYSDRFWSSEFRHCVPVPVKGRD